MTVHSEVREKNEIFVAQFFFCSFHLFILTFDADDGDDESIWIFATCSFFSALACVYVHQFNFLSVK